LASQSDAFCISKEEDDDGDGGVKLKSKRNLRELLETVERTGLMNTLVPGAISVKDELQSIRAWHRERGYHGGLVLRELTKPLYYKHSQHAIHQNQFQSNELSSFSSPPPTAEELPQRECYYLYYEMKANGHSLQQIFCRGTTVRADILSCFQFRFVHDAELNLKLHCGFLRHAERLLNDVEPLLSHAKYNPQATVEVSGHSLGGAVAYIVAMKLKKRGYDVRKCTSIASPRFCDEESRIRVEKEELLPEDALRIEDDLDGVQFLPSRGSSLGDKLWFVTESSGGSGGKKSARYLSRQDIFPSDATINTKVDVDKWNWVDSLWWNCRLPEILYGISTIHRVPSYVGRLQELQKEMEDLEINKQQLSNL